MDSTLGGLEGGVFSGEWRLDGDWGFGVVCYSVVI